MTADPLENLARTGQLKPEPPAEAELHGLCPMRSQLMRDAQHAMILS